MNFLRDPMLVLLISVLLGWAIYEASSAPVYVPANVLESKFSARRAETRLPVLYADELPHVSGSAQNAVLRDQIVTELRSFGYEAEIQSRFHCRAESGRCSPVDNIVARWKGAKDNGAIMLTAHYDSGWAGPGVSDDGVGVAVVLEIARMVSLQKNFTHDVIFLISDAEEQGLIGADAFVRYNPLFESVKVVINLEARGVSGASVMFETGEGNRSMIRILARALDRPVANSVAYEVYRRMPNDTDFSVYRERRLPGYNFAFTQGVSAYHSRVDDLAHLDINSLQHHGQNAWSMLLALDEKNLDRMISTEDAVYIDLFSRKLLHYPASSSPGLALILSVLVIIGIQRAFHRKVVFREVLWTWFSVLVLLILVPVSGWLLSWPLARWVDIPNLDHPFPWSGRAALFMTAVWLTVRTLKFLSFRVFTPSITAACWSLFVLLALVLAYQIPLAGYLGALPLFGFSAGLVIDLFRLKKQPRLLFAGLFGFLTSAYLGFYFFFQLDVILGFELSAFKIMPLLLPMIAILPLLAWYFEGRSHKIGFDNTLLLLLIAACVAQQYLPAYTPYAPREMALMVRQNSGQESALLVLESHYGRADPVYAEKYGFRPTNIPDVDGNQQQVLARKIPAFELPEVVEIGQSVHDIAGGGSRKNHLLELDVPVGVQQLVFSFPKHVSLRNAKLDDQLAFTTRAASVKGKRGQSVVINHPPLGPMRLEFEFSAQQATDVLLTTRFELPKEMLEKEMLDWPEDAEPAFLGPRLIQFSRISLRAN